MKKQFIILLLTLAPIFLLAQDFPVSGTITDSTGTTPLVGASVFCQNTTMGTITGSDGSFSMKLPNGGYDLIISYTGYETKSLRISPSSNSTNIHLSLKPKDKSLQEVAVVGSNEVPDGWQKYGKFLTDNFIGNDSNAAQTTIQNPEVLQFYFSKKRNRLKVKAKEDLIVINLALGYKIKFQLDSFAHEYNSRMSVYTGFPFYEELPGTDEQKLQWKKNRAKAYAGSRLQFMRSWYNRRLEQDGYKLELVDSVAKPIKTTPIANPYDSSLYRTIENNEVEINYNGRLRIVYTGALPDIQYLRENKMPEYLRAQISILDISDGFVILQNGYFYDQNDVINIGYWSWLKLANELPYDYFPE
ncbi:MAG: carboxypeptidase-like regulatory domain-containing protein [Bacteroidota bacterium]|nr:carboxypeptidase-like regulatory domain-containing protein [Bacteroidota bacterium]